MHWNNIWNILNTFLNQWKWIEFYLNSILKLKNDKLINLNWKDIEIMMILLKSFKILIILREKYEILYESINSILWKFDILLNLLETERKKIRSENASFQKILNIFWGKLNKYYQKINKCLMYIIAMILNSRMKYKYFEKHWRKNWLKEIMRKMWIIFNQYHLKKHISDIISISITTFIKSRLLKNNLFDIYK